MTVKTATLADMERRDLPERTDYRGKPTRRLETQWVVKSGTIETGATYEVIVAVSTNHYGKSDMYGYPEKVLKSSFGWTVEQKGNGTDGTNYGVTKWQSDWKSVNLGSVPVARYSKKALVAAHEAAVATALELYEGSNLEAVVEQAAQYEGSKW